MNHLSLDIEPTGASAWKAGWHAGQPVGPIFELGPGDAKALSDIAARFLAFFEDGVREKHRPWAAPGALTALGQALHHLWFEPAGDDLKRLLHPPVRILIRSADRDILNLPWELVEIEPGLPLGCDAGRTLRRTPLPELRKSGGRLEPRSPSALLSHALDTWRETRENRATVQRVAQERPGLSLICTRWF